MPQSLARIVLHLAFSTKDRIPIIDMDLRSPLHGYLASLVRKNNCPCYRVGGVADHVHLAIGLSRTITVADLIEQIKTTSSRWIKSQSSAAEEFAWQRGYGAFSVSPTHLDALLQYIDGQEDHHRTCTFQDEYRAFLHKYDIAYDEKYVWD